VAFRVLIEDDPSAMRAFIRRTIQMSGIDPSEFVEVSNGREALDLLRPESADIILTNINTPTMAGDELLRALKSDELFASVPVAVVSTGGSENRIRQMMALGDREWTQMLAAATSEVLETTFFAGIYGPAHAQQAVVERRVAPRLLFKGSSCGSLTLTSSAPAARTLATNSPAAEQDDPVPAAQIGAMLGSWPT